MKLLIYWIIKYVKSYIDFIFFKIKISLSIKKFTFNWINISGLFKQVQLILTNFLEKNETYIACTQRYRVVDENNNIIKEIYNATGSPKSGDYTLDDFKNYIYFGHCGTLLFRNIFSH